MLTITQGSVPGADVNNALVISGSAFSMHVGSITYCSPKDCTHACHFTREICLWNLCSRYACQEGLKLCVFEESL